MARERRHLAAIVAADVVGFSQMVELDEEGTLQALRALRRELIHPMLDAHGGRIANTAGDSLLIEFPSVVDAVRCLAAVQARIASAGAQEPSSARIELRVGINIGDVVAEGGDLLGGGVNVAARLETLAPAGGIAISEDAHRQIRDRLDLEWVDGGEHRVKNITRPLRVWCWVPGGREPVVLESPVAAASTLPVDKPSIAVLAFDNMSGDPDQEYFSDGIAEDLITSLSKLRWLFVIARNSSFVFKGESTNVGEIGERLGVRYVLEGSVRKVADRIRINAQLVEASTGAHIWAERYDRDLTDIFAVQDEITSQIVAALDPVIRT